ncbi:MAG: phytase, partial [Gammaproteobacteria bacterium]|nr:phytase [Gammaproteobacteria bacterium]
MQRSSTPPASTNSPTARAGSSLSARFGLAASLLALALAGCGSQATPADADESAAADAADLGPALVREAFTSPMTPEDNIDSVASWTSPDGQVLVLATAKATHRLVVYDGFTGEFVRHVGGPGTGAGEFDRPNGIAIADDLAFVVERDNRRVQVLQLPEMESVATFGDDVLRLPYGLWVNAHGGHYELYVTDAYMAGEDESGEDILPPLEELDRRVHRFSFTAGDGGPAATHLGAFGDTSPEGALRVVESLW